MNVTVYLGAHEGNNPVYKQAVAELAGCYGIASRHVWRLLKQADKEPGTRPLN